MKNKKNQPIKNVFLVFTNVFVSSMVAFKLTELAAGGYSNVSKFLNPESRNWASGLFVAIIGLPAFYLISIYFFARVFAKEDMKENIILSIVIPIVLIITYELLI